jgi:protein SCO1/2
MPLQYWLRRLATCGVLLLCFALATCSRPRSTPAAMVLAPGSTSWSIPDVTGRVRTADDYRGRVAALYFGFTNCAEACPTTLAKLSSARRAMGRTGARVQGLFITLDPERDTGERLLQYAQSFDSSFLALRPPPGSVDAAAESFRVFFQRVNRGETYTVDHSSLVYVYDCMARPAVALRPEMSAHEMARTLTEIATAPACSAGR